MFYPYKKEEGCLKFLSGAERGGGGGSQKSFEVVLKWDP